MQDKNRRRAIPLLLILFLCVLVVVFCSGRKVNAISWIPTPCVTQSPAGTPVGPGNVLPCQPTWPGYSQPSPGVSPTATPTPGVITATPSSVLFVGPSASPTTVAITEPLYGGSFAAVPSPAGIVSASITFVTGGSSTLNLMPIAIGTASVAITNSSTQTASVAVAVSPTPIAAGPLRATPNVVLFASPTDSPTAIAITDPNYTGSFTVSPTPAGIVSASITGSGASATLNLSPVAPGQANVGVTDTAGNNTTVAATVNATPGPITFSPNPVIFANPTAPPVTVTINDPNYFGTFTASPTPVGQVSASVGTGNTLTLTPLSVGTPSVIVGDGNSTASLSVIVNAATTPGPIVLSPTSATFSGATPTPLPVTISETNYSGTFSVSASPSDIVSISGSGNSFTLTPAAWGTAVVTVGNTSTQTTTMNVTVNSVASVYSLAVPATPLPLALTAFPTPGTFTFLAQVKCSGTTTTGNSILSIGTTSDLSIQMGACTGSTVTNPTGSTGAHVYLNTAPTASYQSTSANGFSAATNYIIAATNDGGANNGLTFWYCTYPTVVCSQAPSVPSAGLTAYTGSSGYLGVATDGTSRPFGGDIWNLLEYPTGIVFSDTTTMAAFVTATYSPVPDPYPSPTPTATPLTILAQPYSANATAGPLATNLPTPSTWTYLAQIKCPESLANGALSTPNPAGNNVMVIGTSPGNMALEAGQCSTTTNPTGASGTHVFIGSGQQATPANGLAPNPQSYILGASDDGATYLTYFYCTYPVVSCSQSQANVTTPLTWAGGTPNTLIGAASTSNTRLFAGDIWNVRVYNRAFTLAQFTTLANSAQIVANPYTSPAPTVYLGPSSNFGQTAFHHPIATMLNYSPHPAALDTNSATIVNNLLSSGGWNGGPHAFAAMNVVPATGNTAITMYCPNYNACEYNNKTVNLPKTYFGQCYNSRALNGGCSYDYHVTLIDPSGLGGEFDGEGAETSCQGYPTSATSTTVTFSAASVLSKCSVGMFAFVSSGTGQGEGSRITAISGATITVSPAWTTTPTTTNYIAIDGSYGGSLYGSGTSGGMCGLFSTGTMQCDSGGFFPFASVATALNSGLAQDKTGTTGGIKYSKYGTANAGGFAWGVGTVTAAELIAAKTAGDVSLPHAMMLNVGCLDYTTNGTASGIYPSIIGNGSDNITSSNCATAGTNPNVVYGSLVAIKPGVTLPTSYGDYCTILFKTAQTYGMYVTDTDHGNGLVVDLDNYYNDQADWDTIFANMATNGASTGSGPNQIMGCFQKLTPMSTYYNVYRLDQGGTANLPPYYGYGDPRN